MDPRERIKQAQSACTEEVVRALLWRMSAHIDDELPTATRDYPVGDGEVFECVLALKFYQHVTDYYPEWLGGFVSAFGGDNVEFTLSHSASAPGGYWRVGTTI